jgi:hypothetical protein
VPTANLFVGSIVSSNSWVASAGTLLEVLSRTTPLEPTPFAATPNVESTTSLKDDLTFKWNLTTAAAKEVIKALEGGGKITKAVIHTSLSVASVADKRMKIQTTIAGKTEASEPEISTTTGAWVAPFELAKATAEAITKAELEAMEVLWESILAKRILGYGTYLTVEYTEGSSKKTYEGEGSLKTASNLTSQGHEIAISPATIRMAARLTGQGIKVTSASTVLQAAAKLIGQGVKVTPGTATLTAGARLAGTGVKVTASSALIQASAKLTGAGVKVTSAVATLHSSSALTASSRLLVRASGLLRWAARLIGFGESPEPEPTTRGEIAIVNGRQALIAITSLSQAEIAILSTRQALITIESE